jgi:hypothetical protein
MLADLVTMGGSYPFGTIAAIAVLCVAAIWRGTR